MTQPFQNDSVDALLQDCLTLTYNAIHFGEEKGITNRKGMKEFYRSLKGLGLPSCYKVAVMSRACAILESRRKSRKRWVEVRHRKPLRRMVCIISGFFITMKGRLFVPLRRDVYADVQLNRHVQETLAGTPLRSLTITPVSLSLCYSVEVKPLSVERVYGVDRNEKNLTFGNAQKVVQVDISKMVKMKQNTREIMRSFRRNDVRVRRMLARKYWGRAKHRTDQILHVATNLIIDTSAKKNAALALEDLNGIRMMYRRGNKQGADYRFRLNSWPYWKAAMMLEYKAAWKGITIIPLTKAETYGSSTECASCGERLHSPARDDVVHRRMLRCQHCKTWTDRDVNAALNLSKRGLARFASSLPPIVSRSQDGEKGLAGEAVKGNETRTPILRVDASKSGRRLGPTED